MKKTINYLCFSLITLTGMGQVKNAQGYFDLYDGISTAKYYKMGTESYLDYYVPGKTNFLENEYFIRIRKYSWGDTDTAYFREDNKNYYHFDAKTKMESVVLPKEVSIGQIWIEADSSWSYEIIAINEKLQTPSRNYENLIVVECKQLTGRDKEKSEIYHMYYSAKMGMVGSRTNGILSSYLSETKRNAKEGERIGN